MKNKVILGALMSIALCASLIAGATYALFTAEDKTTITVSSAKVQVLAELSDLKTYSFDEEQEAGTFENGGIAKLNNEDGTVVLENVTPGDKATFKLEIRNESNVIVKYYVKYLVEGELVKGLNITETENGVTKPITSQFAPTWTTIYEKGVLHTKEISIELPKTAGNEFQEKQMKMEITVFAVQGNAQSLVEVANAKDLAFALEHGQDVKLTSDITLDKMLVVPASSARSAAATVIDLNGKTINTAFNAGSTTNHAYAFENHGKLVITGNGTINARGIFNYGDITLENATINAIDGNGGYGVRNYEGATLTMNSGTIATTLEDDNKVANGGYDATTVRVDEGATFIMNGGTINNICDYTFAIENHGKTIVNAGNINSVHSTVSSYGELEINGGKFVCNGLEGVTAHALVAWDGSTTNINGGTFDGKDNYNGFNIDAVAGSVVNVNGGEFLPVHSGSLYGEGTINVNGGVFFDDPSARLAAGCVAQKNEEGKWVVKSGLDILMEKLAGSEDVVVVDSTVVIPEGKEVSLDLNGKTIEGTMHKNDGHVINNYGTLTLKNGTIKSAADNGGSALKNSGTAVLENVTLNGAPNANGSWPSYTVNNTGVLTLNKCYITSFHGSVASYDNGTITLNNSEINMKGIPGFTNHGIYTYSNGKVIINGGKYVNHAADQNATGGSVVNGYVVINGGEFVGRIESYSGTPEINGGTFSVKPNAKFVAEGKTVTDNGNGTWTVA